VSNDHVLKAQGYATAAWIAKARLKVADMKYVKAFDDQGLKVLNQVILARAIAALKPPSAVDLSLNKGKLRAQGEADGRWIAFANRHALRVKGVTSFENRVQQVWDAKQVLQQANAMLQPEQGVQLSFSVGVLQARGQASKAWIAFAHKKALHIDGVFTFDEQVAVVYSDEEILKAAMAKLQPPLGVRLQVSHGVLSAVGEAKPTWVEQLKAKANAILGVKSLNFKALKAEVQPDIWQQLNQQVEQLHLVSPANNPLLSDEDEKALTVLSQLLQHAVTLRAGSQCMLLAHYRREEKLVLRIKIQAILKRLKQQGVAKSKVHIRLIEIKDAMRESSIAFELIDRGKK